MEPMGWRSQRNVEAGRQYFPYGSLLVMPSAIAVVLLDSMYSFQSAYGGSLRWVTKLLLPEPEGACGTRAMSNDRCQTPMCLFHSPARSDVVLGPCS